MALSHLLSKSARSGFMEQYFSRLPFVQAQGCIDFSPLGSWRTIERILGQPNLDLVVGDSRGQRSRHLPTTVAEAKTLLAANYTLGIRKAQRHDEGLAELAESFRSDFLAPVDVHIYCTPADEPGFGWHYDAEDVFILQTLGSKQWWLRKNTVNPWPLVETLPCDMRYEQELMPVLRCTLAAGDWLYIPHGYWHRTEAGEESISLSVGILSPTGLDVFDFVRQHLLDSLRWRQRLPSAGDAGGLTEEQLVTVYAERFAELGNDLAAQFRRAEFVRHFLKSLHRSQET
jgi:50S ribosomal protein L16 3-hydroxylase